MGDFPRIPFRNILVATDFSPCSQAILPYAASLARKFAATLFIAHAVSPEVISVDPPVVHEMHETAARQMKDFVASDQLEGVRHNGLVLDGEPGVVLATAVRDNQIDLAIVGTHGRTGIKKFVMGSVAEQLFRKLPCPVLTLGPKVCAESRRDPKFLHILFATDFGPGSTTALPFVVSLVKASDAVLTLYHAISTAPATDTATAASVLRNKLTTLVPAEAGLSTPPEAVVEIGDPAELIVRTAAIRRADLVVLGAHRPAALTAHTMDTAYKVMINAPCPVLTIGASAQARTTVA